MVSVYEAAALWNCTPSDIVRRIAADDLPWRVGDAGIYVTIEVPDPKSREVVDGQASVEKAVRQKTVKKVLPVLPKEEPLVLPKVLEDCVSAEEAAGVMKISVERVVNLIESGRLRSVGRRFLPTSRLVRRRDVMEYCRRYPGLK